GGPTAIFSNLTAETYYYFDSTGKVVSVAGRVAASVDGIRAQGAGGQPRGGVTSVPPEFPFVAGSARRPYVSAAERFYVLGMKSSSTAKDIVITDLSLPDALRWRTGPPTAPGSTH